MAITIFKTLVCILVTIILILFTMGQSDTFDSIYKEVGQKQEIDPALLRAIAQVESNRIVGAVNISDPSFGLMQIFCTPNREGICTNQFPSIENWEGTTVKKLFDPHVNITIGAKILKWNLEQYGYPKGIAVYNSWSARKDPQEGPFRNQKYVDEVLKNYKKFKNE